MTKCSKCGSIEVTVADKPTMNGQYSVTINQKKPGNIWAYITVQFGGGNDHAIQYKTQDLIHSYSVSGQGQIPAGVDIVVTNILN